MKTQAKAPRTEVQLIFGNEKPKIFLVPNEKMSALKRRVVEAMSNASTDEELVPAEEVFPILSDPVMRPAFALRTARMRAKLTQKELAKKIGCEQADISKMESAKISIGKARAKKLSTFLGIGYRVFL